MTVSKKCQIAFAAIIAVVITGLAILIPFIRARSTPFTNACVNNLRQVDGAKQQWTLEYGKTTTDTPSWEDLRPFLGRHPEYGLPSCPQGGDYTAGRVGESPQCSIGPPYHTLH